MTELLVIAGGLLYGASLLFCYRMGVRDGRGEETPPVPILAPKKPKSKPTTEEELKAAERQRRIDEFRG